MTSIVDRSKLTTRQLFFLGFYAGLSLEAALHGLVWSVQRWMKESNSKYTVTVSIIVVGNMFAALYSALNIAGFFLNKEQCRIINYIETCSRHLFLISFAIFILYKSFYIANKSRFVQRCSFVLIATRVVAGGFDFYKSSGVFDEGTCRYLQNEVSGLLYYFIDILIDLFTTATCVTVVYRRFDYQSGLGRQLVEHNVLRSVVISTMSAFLMYVSAYWNNPFKISVAWAVQNYILVRCLNSDIFARELFGNNIQNKTDMKRRISTLLRSKSLLRRSSFHQDDEEPFPPSLNAARNTISFHSSPTRRSVSGYQDHRHSQITANSGIRRTSTFGPGLRMDLNTTTSKVMRAASSSCGSGDMTGSASSSPDFSSDELKARLPKSLVGDFGTLRSVRGSARSGRRVSETIAGPAALNCVKTSVTDDNDSR